MSTEIESNKVRNGREDLRSWVLEIVIGIIVIIPLGALATFIGIPGVLQFILWMVMWVAFWLSRAGSRTKDWLWKISHGE